MGAENGYPDRTVTVDIPGQEDVTVALEQLASSLRLVRRGAPPARFDEVPAGFFSVVVTLADAQAPDRTTAWTQL